MACYDQLNMFNNGAAEIVARQLQLIEEKYKEKLLTAHGDAGEDSHLFMGTRGTRGGLCVCPDLQAWIAGELQKESAVLKERRKAREERTLARPKGGGNPGKDKGGGGGAASGSK